jgi:hypothetical protein
VSARIAARPSLWTFALVAMSVAMAAIVWVTYYGWQAVDAWCFYYPTYGRTDFQYLWSPAFAQLTAPLRLLPFDAFAGLVRALELGSLLVLAPLYGWVAMLLPPVAAELHAANINLILIACVVASFRWPVAWTLPLLTKPSLGVGLLWYVVRREWRSLMIATGVPAAIALVSFVLAPSLWFDWVNYLATGASDAAGWPFPWPVWPRLPIAIALVVWGARTDRRWTVALAAVIAMPRLYFQTPAMLIGLIPLIRLDLPLVFRPNVRRLWPFPRRLGDAA